MKISQGSGTYQIVHASTRRTVRRSNWSEKTVLDGLQKLCENYPDADFLITDLKGNPIPASRLRP